LFGRLGRKGLKGQKRKKNITKMIVGVGPITICTLLLKIFNDIITGEREVKSQIE
jgi:5,10-methylene-tetrahydrofolate dehydrogenase/methenyl tetrahydrofolate cyclohydrolase